MRLVAVAMRLVHYLCHTCISFNAHGPRHGVLVRGNAKMYEHFTMPLAGVSHHRLAIACPTKLGSEPAWSGRKCQAHPCATCASHLMCTVLSMGLKSGVMPKRLSTFLMPWAGTSHCRSIAACLTRLGTCLAATQVPSTLGSDR